MLLLIFPHQLFDEHPGLKLQPSHVVLLEDSLFFGDDRYPMRFHKQKLWLHRATMKRYEEKLQQDGFQTIYLDYDPQPSSLARHIERLRGEQPQAERLVTIDPTDFMLAKRLDAACVSQGIQLERLANPGFLNSPTQNQSYRNGKKRWFMADFYRDQRQRLDILMDGDDPVGQQWSFDEANRKKVPKKLLDAIPAQLELERDAFDSEAQRYVEQRFPSNPGQIDRLYYPTSHQSAQSWLKEFLTVRLAQFGDFEDAIVQGQSWLWHSVLTPSLNVGLLTPHEIVRQTLHHADSDEVPLNSLEGFLRQIIGWREFVRATYEDLGVAMRTTNHWQHQRPMPTSFYDATTGMMPIDDTIGRVLETGYCHHIERLMILGGFMFLCEIDPDDVYRWFMEMFVDSYDWVMVPNVYAMSQHADGGLITTKPYFSGSSYVRKQSHYKKSPWCDIWDGLYWRWIWNHVDDLSQNPRWAMMCSMAKKMDAAKRKTHLANAEKFLEQL